MGVESFVHFFPKICPLKNEHGFGLFEGKNIPQPWRIPVGGERPAPRKGDLSDPLRAVHHLLLGFEEADVRRMLQRILLRARVNASSNLQSLEIHIFQR